ncbi:MAG: TM1812 family CRISPR-associated protein [Eubacteriales bacterium]|nr:TM1812 family CRISPR-associated protein [Eubacteriales bacterium]
MNKEKNILITTLGFTKDHLHAEYYSSTDTHGELRFCTGISSAEAGTKYILSQYNIDEILVLGPKGAGGAQAEKPRPLSSYTLPVQSSLDAVCEYDFFCYRISQYLDRLDIETDDILYEKTEEQRSELLALMRRAFSGGRGNRFLKAATTPEAFEQYKKVMAEPQNAKDERWIKHMMFAQMNPFFRMNALRSNEAVSARFVPMEKDEKGSFTIESMVKMINNLAMRLVKGVNIYIDIHGMDKADSYTMWSMLAMVYCSNERFRVKSIIHTRLHPDRFTHSIDDEIGRYEVETLLSGMQAFVRYGKMELLEEFCTRHEVKDPAVLNLLKAMKYVDVGVSMCNMSDLTYGIQALKMIFRRMNEQPRRSTDTGTSLFSVLRQGIERDYGDLLEGEEVSVPALISWALRKQFYQQALTMIEALVPSDIVRRGIYYYARSVEDVGKALESWNLLFWNEIPKCRYVFNDLDHFFLKNYPRSVINNRQPREKVSQDLSQVLVDQLHGAYPMLCNTYSDLGDDNMLYDIFLHYYEIGNLRNQVSHARSEERALAHQEELHENENFLLLQKAIERFLRIYRAACAKVQKTAEPICISGWQFRAYTAEHRLAPLTGLAPDLLLEDTYSCSYNGQDLQINVRMLRPQDDMPTE